MIVLKVEFSIFNTSIWKRRYYKIYSKKIEQMEESAKQIIAKNKGEVNQEYINSKWETIKKDITNVKIKFPLIYEK